MRITFVAIGWEQLGVSLLSALAKQQGHEVFLAYHSGLFNDRYNLSIPLLATFFDETKSLIKIINKQNPDIIAFSTLTSTYRWQLQVAEEVKNLLPNVKVLFGGVHPSAVPEKVIQEPQVDFVCVGEGERAFISILKSIEHNNCNIPIANTLFKSTKGQIIRGRQEGFIQDLDLLPIFDKALWENHIRIADLYFTMASRGCPYSCTFCFNSFYSKLGAEGSGKYIRHRSPEHMLYELKRAKKRYKMRMVDFEDDIFTINKKWLKVFLDKYKKEINVPFQCLSHPKFIDEKVSQWLSQAGCVYIQMGIQTMDDKYKCDTIKRFEKSQQVEQAMQLMKKYKIKAKVDHMFGLPGEPIEAQKKALDFYIKYPPYRIQTFWMNFLPGTEILNEGLKRELITPEDVTKINEGYGSDFYRKSQKIKNPEKLKLYKVYEVLFKFIPFLPYRLRQCLHPKLIRFFPVYFCSGITFILDACIGLITRNPDHLGYAKYYIYHLRRWLLNKLHISVPPATKVFKLDAEDGEAWNHQEKDQMSQNIFSKNSPVSENDDNRS